MLLIEGGYKVVQWCNHQDHKTIYHKNLDKGRQTDAIIMDFIIPADTKAELKPALDRVMHGKDVDGVESPLGRGKRKSVPEARFSDSESDMEIMDEKDQPLSSNKE